MIAQRLLSYNYQRKNIIYDILFDFDITKNYNLYFKSIKGTLNHIMIAEILWYLRISGLREISLNNTKYDYNNVSEYWTSKYDQDIFVKQFSEESNKDYLIQSKIRNNDLNNLFNSYLRNITEKDFIESNINYSDTEGNKQSKKLCDSIFHIVNHSTHHIGQITTILCQENINIPSTDFTCFY